MYRIYQSLILKYICRHILTGYYEFLELRRYSTSFSFQLTPIMICPYFQMISQTIMILIQIVQYNSLLILISIPPLICQFKVWIWIFLSCQWWLSNTTGTIYPLSLSLWFIRLHFHMILSNCLKSPIILNIQVRRNIVQFSFHCQLLNPIPINLCI